MMHWPVMNFLLFILTQACKEFEQRVLHLKSPRGEKTEAILAAVDRRIATFRVADLQAECPGVGVDLIRRTLARLQKAGKIRALGTGRSAKWETAELGINSKLRIKLRIEARRLGTS